MNEKRHKNDFFSIALSDTAGKVCSLCRVQIIAGEHITSCSKCFLPFHEECWDENGGCSQYGFLNAPETIKQETNPDIVAQAWGNEKECPQCGEKIKARAVLCRFCGTKFNTREAISAAKFAVREYEIEELFTIRNKIIAMFFTTAIGIPAPLMAILHAKLIFGKKLGNIEYHRLPPVLKTIEMIGLCISIFYTILAIILIAFD